MRAKPKPCRSRNLWLGNTFVAPYNKSVRNTCEWHSSHSISPNTCGPILGTNIILPGPVVSQCACMFGVTVVIYSNGTLEALHNLICSGFPDWEDYRALVEMATNVSPHMSPHRLCLPVVTHRKQSESLLDA